MKKDDQVLELQGVGRNFGSFAALRPTNLDIQVGDIYALIGKNGAGKTTMFKMITGQILPSEGELFLFGKHTQSELLDERKKIGAIIETPGFFPNFTARQNLKYYRVQRGIPDEQCEIKALEEVGLSDTGKKKFKDFSLGMKQRLGLALALMTHPAFLILDEPINGLDPEGIVEIRNLLLKLNREKNITILISSHILSEVHSLATRIGFIDQGRMVEEWTTEQLDKRSKKYLKVQVDNAENAAAYLDQYCKKAEYTVMPDNVLHIFGYLDQSDYVNTALTEHGVRVFSIQQQGDNLEEYFLNLVGGVQNA
jgi:ABC-2 type transport system ATP-binding protein